MPSRWLSLTIIAFWLATMGWLFWHDLWPNWRPGEAPPFHIDLVEEVQNRDGDSPKTFWAVTRNVSGKDVPVFRATTWVDYHREDDTFSLSAEFRQKKSADAGKVNVGLLEVRRMTSEYRVTRDERLRAMKVEVQAHHSGTNLDVNLTVWGEVEEGQFLAHYRLPNSLGVPLEGDLRPVPVSHHGSMLMPLHPVNRIHRLRPGQSWRMPLVDPLREAITGPAVKTLSAHVLPQPQVLQENGRSATCLVIEYEGEDVSGRTWVEQDTEYVQRQEATMDKVRWVIQRETSPGR